jgi:N-acetylneuraminic acid mutarotase
MYIQGGYSNFNPLANFLVQFDLSQSPLELTVVSKNADIPSSRYYHTMNVIYGKFWMYGGSDGSQSLDELWTYDSKYETWSLQEPKGLKPPPRSGHASATLGNNLVIWGGRDAKLIFNDMYFYNTVTNTWELITPTSTLGPIAVEGACLTEYNDDLYLFGGRSDFSSHNHLWKFNVGLNKWTLLSDNKFNSPRAIAYSECWSFGSTI